GSDAAAPSLQIGQGNAISLTLFAQPVCRWHPQPIKGNLAGIRGVLTELVVNPYHLITGTVGRYDNGADATRAGIRIGDREDDNPACRAPRGDELLGTVQHIAVTSAASPGAQ